MQVDQRNERLHVVGDVARRERRIRPYPTRAPSACGARAVAARLAAAAVGRAAAAAGARVRSLGAGKEAEGLRLRRQAVEGS